LRERKGEWEGVCWVSPKKEKEEKRLGRESMKGKELGQRELVWAEATDPANMRERMREELGLGVCPKRERKRNGREDKMGLFSLSR